MKLLLWAASALMLGFGLAPSPQKQKPQDVLLISGAAKGYIAPCGCSKPMSGGIKRRASAIKALGGEEAVLIEQGPLTSGAGRQEILKAETLAMALKSMGVDAVAWTQKDSSMGPGQISSLQRLSGGKIVSGSLEPGGIASLNRSTRSGRFLITSIDPALTGEGLETASVDVATAVHRLIDQAQKQDLVSVLMTTQNLAESRRLAAKHPALDLIVFASDAAPSAKPILVGSTSLVSPGPKGRHVLRLVWDDSGIVDSSAVLLGPEWKDDELVSQFYEFYLDQVEDEQLIKQVVRVETKEFAGSETCLDCHPVETKAWQNSAHAKAFTTLEKTGHDIDPECVGCHVVGLDSTKGFQDRKTTPNLAAVGCESCHGPSAEHTRNPTQNRPATSAVDSCKSCHVPDHSPEFTYDDYWPLIKH
jgi:hypothetical protein